MHNNIILPLSHDGLHGARDKDIRVSIGYNYLKENITKHIKPISNRNKITCVCETCISFLLLQSNLNKWGFSQLDFL